MVVMKRPDNNRTVQYLTAPSTQIMKYIGTDGLTINFLLNFHDKYCSNLLNKSTSFKKILLINKLHRTTTGTTIIFKTNWNSVTNSNISNSASKVINNR